MERWAKVAIAGATAVTAYSGHHVIQTNENLVEITKRMSEMADTNKALRGDIDIYKRSVADAVASSAKAWAEVDELKAKEKERKAQNSVADTVTILSVVAASGVACFYLR